MRAGWGIVVGASCETVPGRPPSGRMSTLMSESLCRTFGQRPRDGWNLYLSMHGGGGAPAALNDQQWENQVKLYQPKDSLYIAPRAPTDNWNLWHESHIDPLFNRLIEDAIALADVNPDRVYIMGYSAGGDGV